jgi:hypothetical protein
MRLVSCCISATLATGLALLGASAPLLAQQSGSALVAAAAEETLDAPLPQIMIAADEPPAPQTPEGKNQTAPQPDPGAMPTPASKQQPKRILGIMPNYRAVSAGEIPPPPTASQAFKIATQNSFDYSSFIFVGITSLMAEGTNAHTQLGKGMEGYGRYYWRGLADKTIGNYMVIFTLPTVLHEDERYYAKGEGTFLGRGIYAASRVLITPDYHGRNSFNASEIFGRGIAQGISLSYYPSGSQTAESIASKYAYAIGRDALTNTFREFWPDIATHVLHRHP